MPRQRTPDETHAIRQSISVLPEDMERLKRYCEKQERDYSWVFRKALKMFLDAHEDDPVI